MGLRAAGKEMAVSSSVQVGLTIVIFKEKKKLGHRGGQTQSPGTDGGGAAMSGKGISQPPSQPSSAPQLPPPSSLARTPLPTYLESPSCSQDKYPFHRS